MKVNSNYKTCNSMKNLNDTATDSYASLFYEARRKAFTFSTKFSIIILRVRNSIKKKGGDIEWKKLT